MFQENLGGKVDDVSIRQMEFKGLNGGSYNEG